MLVAEFDSGENNQASWHCPKCGFDNEDEVRGDRREDTEDDTLPSEAP
jgi:hypothetical protein